jgi:UDP-galactopyranose mutase
MIYDYLIVGSGLFGSDFAYLAKKNGKKCLVIEKRNHIAGNCYTENRDNINIHIYGPHIFHTSDDRVWKFMNELTDFHQYKHSPKVNFNGNIYSFPINLLTLNQLWGVKTPKEALDKLKEVKFDIKKPKNLEEWCLSEVGQEIYETFVKGYTQKQWQKDPKLLPTSIIKRLPIRTNFDDNYYFDKYQGIPVGGYTQIFDKLLDGIEVKTNTDYFSNKDYYDSISEKIVYTVKIDQFFDYKFGELEYRTLDLIHKGLDIEDFQGVSVMNYTSINVPYTRITEHKHFEKSKSNVTWITEEYSKEYKRGDIPYYPINDDQNNIRYNKYNKLKEEFPKFIFGGRLSEYKYYDMHQVVASAIHKFNKDNNL